MPLPGPSFVRSAEGLGDTVRIAGAKEDKKLDGLPEDTPNLHMLYTYALYEPWFCMEVQNKGRWEPVQFIPGHLGTASRAVGPRSHAKVMVVGKMPGEEESRLGLHFVGPTGFMLRSVLSELGVKKEEYRSWYYTNVLKFAPPGRKFKDNTVSMNWYKDCRILLHQEICVVRPDYVLCLGAEASHAVLRTTGPISALTNQVHDCRVRIDAGDAEYDCADCGGEGVITMAGEPSDCPICGGGGKVPGFPVYHEFKTMCAIHPVNVVRDPGKRPQFRDSVSLFLGLVAREGRPAPPPQRDYHVISNEAELEAEVDKLVARTPTGAVIAVDAEWHGEDPQAKESYLRTIQMSDRKGYALCVELTAMGGKPLFEARDGRKSVAACVPHLRRLLKSTPERKVRIAGHFFRADLPQIRHHLGLDLLPEHLAPADDGTGTAHFRTAWEGGFDTGLAAHAVCETDEYKLEVLCSTKVGMTRWDGKLMAWKKKHIKEKKDAAHKERKRAKAENKELSSEELLKIINGPDTRFLKGYGDCPREVLFAEEPYYAMSDVDGTRQLVDYYNGVWSGPWEMVEPGMLDDDHFREGKLPSNNVRRAFWTSMRAVPAALEIETWGLTADKKRGTEIRLAYKKKREQLVEELREEVCWNYKGGETKNDPPRIFQPGSANHCRELLYGEGYSGTLDKERGGATKRLSPPGAKLLGLTPIKSTNKHERRSWADLVAAGEAKHYTPATDKETLGILAAESPVARKLRNIRFLTQLLNTTLQKPIATPRLGDDERRLVSCKLPKNLDLERLSPDTLYWEDPVTKQKRDMSIDQVYPPGVPIYRAKAKKTYVDREVLGPDGEPVYASGLLHHISERDGRIRTRIRQVLETGRWASSKPNLQNITKRREDDYKRIMGDDYIAPIRTLFVAAPGYVLAEADILGAELAIMAWDSQDAKMIDHVRRAQLPESHPDFYDIHSNVAVLAFQLKVNSYVYEKKNKAHPHYGLPAWKVLGLPEGAPLPPTKEALAVCGYKALRVAAKNVIFGYAYGRGADAISRQCKEEGADVSVAQAQQLIEGLTRMYPGLRPFFEKARNRVETPGWQCSDFGYYRRTKVFEESDGRDNSVVAELKRQFMNFRVQNAVAGHISRSLDHLYHYREEHPHLKYRICLQIHDAVISEVPVDQVEEYHDVVLPECMIRRVPIWPCDFDGNPLESVKEPYYFGIDREVMLRWGEKITDVEAARKWGVPERFIKKPRGKAA